MPTRICSVTAAAPRQHGAVEGGHRGGREAAPPASLDERAPGGAVERDEREAPQSPGPRHGLDERLGAFLRSRAADQRRRVDGELRRHPDAVRPPPADEAAAGKVRQQRLEPGAAAYRDEAQALGQKARRRVRRENEAAVERVRVERVPEERVPFRFAELRERCKARRDRHRRRPQMIEGDRDVHGRVTPGCGSRGRAVSAPRPTAPLHAPRSRAPWRQQRR